MSSVRVLWAPYVWKVRVGDGERQVARFVGSVRLESAGRKNLSGSVGVRARENERRVKNRS